jgi:hypothetical protein
LESIEINLPPLRNSAMILLAVAGLLMLAIGIAMGVVVRSGCIESNSSRFSQAAQCSNDNNQRYSYTVCSSGGIARRFR